MPKKHSNNYKQTSLFDIRLKNLDRDVLVLKGNHQDAASVLLSGKIAISVNEPLTIKKLSLRLYATMRMNINEHSTSPRGGKPLKFEKKLYEHEWEDQEINSYLNEMYEKSGTNFQVGLSRSPNHSSTALKSLGNSLRTKSSNNLSSLNLGNSSRTKSSSNLSNLSMSTPNRTDSNSSSHTLVQGNYEIPFSAVLPGSMPESVEGLPGASVVYKLEAVIDKGKFHNKMVAKKHLRVLRTLTTDAVELSETVAVDNTWPKKVEYSLNVPSKAIAIGGNIPISFMLVPLLKGLKLGDIKIQLVEFYSCMGYMPPPYNDERIIASKVIPKPKEDDPNFQKDKWEIDNYMKTPDSLSKCTQDCDIQNFIKVRHKLKFIIGLINPDNHVSELRASLPVQLFISPFVSIRARYEDNEDDQSSYDENDGEEFLFASDNGSHTSLRSLNTNENDNNELSSNPNSYTSFNGIMAPPVYEQHVYDKLWSDVSPVETPTASGASTPGHNSYFANRNIGDQDDVQSQFSMSPLDSVQLNENLRQLSLQRQLQESANGSTTSLPGRESSRDRPVFNIGENNSRGEANQGETSVERPNLLSSLSRNSLNANSFPGSGIPSPPMHISRVNSDSNFSSPNLSRVPSYSQAMRSDTNDGALSPAYEPPLPGSSINLSEIDRNTNSSPNNTSNGGRGRPDLSRGTSIKGAPSHSHTSSNSSPSNSRNVSSTNLAALSGVSLANLSRSPSKGFSGNNASAPSSAGSISPGNINQKGDLSSNTLSHTNPSTSITQPSSSASNRNAAVLGNQKKSVGLNVPFLNKKSREKK